MRKKTVAPTISGKAFIQTFHSKYPGATTLALSGAKDAQGRSSYDLLAALADGLPRTAQILDLACGDGYLLHKIRERRDAAELSLVGVDLNEAELAIAEARGLEEARFIQADATDLPFPEERFDLVLCHMAFMLFEDPDAVARQIFDVLQPGGTFAFVLGDGSSKDGALRRFISLVKDAIQIHGGACPMLGTRQARNIESLTALLQRAGFQRDHIAPLQIAIEGSPQEVFTGLKLMYNFEALTREGQAYVEEQFFNENASLERSDGYRMSLIQGVFKKPVVG